MRMRSSGVLSASVLVVLFAGCSVFTGVDGTNEVALTTDSRHYTVSVIHPSPSVTWYTVSVVTRYRNFTRDTVFLERCDPTSRTPTHGVSYLGSPTAPAGYGAGWACKGHESHLAVAPGDVRVDTLLLVGPNSYDQMVALEGSFRLYFVPMTCRSGNCEIEEDRLRASNTFHLTLPK